MEDGLDINCLYETFHRITNSHKYFWFLSLLSAVEEGLTACGFNYLANDMIYAAQPFVIKQHLSLGFRDTLEAAIISIYGKDSIDPQKLKSRILDHVPYRFLSSFAKSLTEKDMNGNRKALASKLNRIPHLPYRFTNLDGLESTIAFEPDWYAYFQEHHRLLRDWTLEMLRTYLEKRNGRSFP